MLHGTGLFVDGPCRLQKVSLTFEQQPPEFVTCRGTVYTYSANQGIQYLNYVVKDGPNDAGSTSGAAGRGQIHGQRDVFRAWGSLHHALNHTVPRRVNSIRQAGRRIRRAVR